MNKTKTIILSALLTTVVSAPVLAADQLKIGVAMSNFDDNFLNVLRKSMESRGEALGVSLQMEDGKAEIGTQLNQFQNFIASGVDAIIVNPVDTNATVTMSDDAAAAGIPLVYVNRMPINIDMLPKKQAVVASKEIESGTLQAQEVCRQLSGKGKLLIIMGDLGYQAALDRTKAVHDVAETPECSGLEIVEEQVGKWTRTGGNDLMTNWLSAGLEFDAVLANNDEMAIGAIQALKAVGRSMDDGIVAGIDATQDALASMEAGDLDITVFQNAIGQGADSVDAAIKLAKGEPVDKIVWIPFELVTPENMSQFRSGN